MNGLTRQAPAFGRPRREFDRLFNDVVSRSGGGGVRSAVWAPSADISETEDRYLLRLDLPGCSKKELEIELRGETL